MRQIAIRNFYVNQREIINFLLHFLDVKSNKKRNSAKLSISRHRKFCFFPLIYLFNWIASGSLHNNNNDNDLGKFM